jgi:hypothetical protein
MKTRILIALSFIFIGCNKVDKSKMMVQKEVIDSSWYKRPGEINTLQTDFWYFGKTNSGRIIKNNSRQYKVGDTINIISPLK